MRRTRYQSLFFQVAQSCPTFCDPMDYTVHDILQARLLEWIAFPFSRGSSQPRDRTQVSHIAGGFFTSWATREAHGAYEISLKVYLLVGVIGSCFTYPYNNKLTEAMRILIEGEKIIKKTWSDVKWRGVYSEVKKKKKKGIRCQKEKSPEEERCRVGCRRVSKEI